ncbi:nucleotidyltransferase domain-containing protein [Paenibacillus sp. P46E]|uniref:nucleotidyltransferase domain-containing protein n=1 Tax=Paenibacillus sp. P46E TaxID=1349436 RepID=UPI00095DD1D1|nr:nucleotidyltransferase domain-containing protein [Paenibacillus sp. P46E]OKP99462.1 hypothetical protein A3849_04440 [Paenibacillus sp. P46E]
MNELRFLLNDAIGKNLNKGSKLYQAYHDKIWERYGFASILKTNRYNYLFGLLTGTSAYKNSAGNASWAREELIREFFDANLSGYIASMAMDGVTHVSTVKIKNPTVTDSEAVVPKGTGKLTIPQGVTSEQFNNASSIIRQKVGSISDDIVVQGSRANGTARPDSDIDFAVRVSPEKFDELITQRFGIPNPGSAKERTMQHAIETGKIQSGEAGLRSLRQELQKALGMDVDISIVKSGGPFDNGTQIPLP